MFIFTESWLISNFKKLVISTYLWSVYVGTQKQDSLEKHLRHKKREEEEAENTKMQKKKQKKGEATNCEEVDSFKKPTTCW